MMAMTLKQEVLPVFLVLLVFISATCNRNHAISEQIKNIFLKKPFNSTDTEWLLKSARDSYLMLKSFENQSDACEKLNFVNSYSNFLLKLFEYLQTKEANIYEIFSKEENFLKDYSSPQNSTDFKDFIKLQSAIKEIQIAAEHHLIIHYNTSSESLDALKVLKLNKTYFDAFLKEKLRADYFEIGFFFIEVFATLIGLSWGIISTVLHVARPMTEQ